MTKHDYIMVAEVLCRARELVEAPGKPAPHIFAQRQVVGWIQFNLAKRFAVENPKFNDEIFNDECEPIGR